MFISRSVSRALALSLFSFVLAGLSSRVAAQAPAKPAATPTTTPIVSVGGFLQTDWRVFGKDAGNRYVNNILVRRLRVDVNGTVNKYVSFRVVPDFAGSKISVTDAYADFAASPSFKLRIGKAKVPFSYERAQSSTNNLFVETGSTLTIAPNYDIGAQLLGDVWSGALAFNAGVFNGVPDGQSLDEDVDDSKEVAGRIQLTPFVTFKGFILQGFTFGAGVTHAERKGTTAAPQLPSYKTAGQSTFLSYANTVVANGVHERLAAYAAEYYGPLSVVGEWVQSKQALTNTSTATPAVVTNGTFKHRAYQVYGTVVVTGERASFRGVAPKAPFDPANGKWGALELAVRYDNFTADKASAAPFVDLTRSSTEATSRTVGLNWYLTNKVRIETNYQYTNFVRGATSGDHAPERVLLTRVQTVF